MDNWGLGVGTLLSGSAAACVAIATGIGSFLRYRKAAKNIQNQVSNEAIVAIQAAADKLEHQYEARMEQYEKTIELQAKACVEQAHMYEERLNNLQSFNATLLGQILKHTK